MQLITPCSLSADHTARVAWEHRRLEGTTAAVTLYPTFKWRGTDSEITCRAVLNAKISAGGGWQSAAPTQKASWATILNRNCMNFRALSKYSPSLLRHSMLTRWDNIEPGPGLPQLSLPLCSRYRQIGRFDFKRVMFESSFLRWMLIRWSAPGEVPDLCICVFLILCASELRKQSLLKWPFEDFIYLINVYALHFHHNKLAAFINDHIHEHYI